MKICIFGGGSIGGLLAVNLEKIGLKVSVIARGQHLEAMKKNGLTLINPLGDETTAVVNCTDDAKSLGVQDYLFLTIKSPALLPSLKTIRPLVGKNTAIITCMNGIPHWYFHKLDSKYANYKINCLDPDLLIDNILPPDNIVGSVVYPACEIIEPGKIKHIAGNRFSLGEPDGSESDRIKFISETFKKTGLRAPIQKNIRDEIWLKLIGNLSFNPISALTGGTLEQICNDQGTEEIVREMANLRLEKAQLMGFTNHAELSLQKTMAKSSNGVNALLNQVWEPAKAMAQEEIKDMQDLIQEEGNNFALQAWDWMHYSEKVRKRKYDFDSAEVQPYLEMDAIRDSAFELASRLFGIKFIQKNDIPKYHPDVDTFEVLDKNGDHLGVFLTDYFARPSKQGGAWMNTFRDQSNFDGRVRPIVLNVCNFAKPNDGEKAFLTFEHAETLFHEFGHALHGLLSDVDYPYLSGTSVTRDYVEFPSQLMENWIRHSDFLAEFAKHFETGKPIPKRLLEKMSSAGTFNQGFATTEYMIASMLDLAWHTIESPVENTEKFEQTLFKEIGKPVEIDSRYGSTYFGHIFAGGYAAGYYSYMWSEVLDSHAFEIFDKEGLYDSEYAEKLEDFVYSSGNSVDLMNQYKKFRGEEPNVSSLLRKRGLN